MAQHYKDMVCVTCGEPNPAENQDFCKDLGCSGRMVCKTYTSDELALSEKDFIEGGILHESHKKSVERAARRLCEEIDRVVLSAIMDDIKTNKIYVRKPVEHKVRNG